MRGEQGQIKALIGEGRKTLVDGAKILAGGDEDYAKSRYRIDRRRRRGRLML